MSDNCDLSKFNNINVSYAQTILIILENKLRRINKLIPPYNSGKYRVPTKINVNLFRKLWQFNYETNQLSVIYLLNYQKCCLEPPRRYASTKLLALHFCNILLNYSCFAIITLLITLFRYSIQT